MSEYPVIDPVGDPRRLGTRAQAAAEVGYSAASLATVMRRNPGVWPSPVGRWKRGRTWVLLWDLDEIVAAAPPATAVTRRLSMPTVSGGDGLLTCLECGRVLRALGRHLRQAHGLTAEEYRARHQLPAGAALVSDGQRERLGALMADRMAKDPDALSHLTRYQDKERLDGMRVEAITSLRQTQDYEIVRQHRAPGREHAAARMAAVRRDMLQLRLREAGFADVEDAIARTAHMSVADAAAATTLGRTSIRRWRQRLNQGGENHMTP